MIKKSEKFKNPSYSAFILEILDDPYCSVTTNSVSDMFNISYQHASNILREMWRKGWLSRKVEYRKPKIRYYIYDITEKGYNLFLWLYKKGVYDELNEGSSPFNAVNLPLPVEVKQPSISLKNVEYGARFSSTLREVDWSLYYFYDVACDGTYFYLDEWDLNRYDMNGDRVGMASFDEYVLGSAFASGFYWTLNDLNQIRCWDLSGWPSIVEVPGNALVQYSVWCRRRA